MRKNKDHDTFFTAVRIIAMLFLIAGVCIFPGCKKPEKSESKGPQLSPLEVMANKAIMKKNYEQAKDLLEGALRTDTQNVDILYNLAVIADNQKKYREAERYYKEILKINRDDSLALGGLGWLEFMNKNYEKSLEYSKKAITVNPKLIPPYYNIALVYVAQEKLSDAMKSYYEATVVDENGANATMAIGDLNNLLKTSDMKNRAFVHYPLAYLYKMIGDRDNEKKSLQDFIAQYPKHELKDKAQKHLDDIDLWEQEEKSKEEEKVDQAAASPENQSKEKISG